MYPGADPGFCFRGDESRRGVWGPVKVSSGRGPRKLLGFEYLGSFSVNNFEAFCECDEVSVLKRMNLLQKVSNSF